MKKFLLPLLLLSSQALMAQFITNNGIDIVNTGIIFTNGDWVNQGTIRNNGTIITTESWTNTGTLDPASTGGFVLQYAADKTFTPGGTVFGFLVKEGSGNASITGQFSVTDSLSIQGGIITPLTASDILTVAETGTVKSIPGSFLEGGNLVRKGTGNLFFPVGKNGIPLPVTFLSVAGTNPSISVTVEDAPVGYTAGAGVNALIDFPYVWKAVKTNVTDSSYVEVEYPNTISAATDVVVVRKTNGVDSYEGMGARTVTSAANTIKIKSYSRGAQGTFSVAKGFPGNLETDKRALEDFFDATGGSSTWTNKTNWKTPDVTTWTGVTETGGYITALSLPNNKITGSIPPSFADLGGLKTIDLSNNKITSLPDLSSVTGITSLNVSKNALDFAAIIPNVGISGINYADQAALTPGDTALIDVGTNTTLSITTAGDGNEYQWKLNGTAIDGAINSSFDITNIGRAQMGNYTLEVTNPTVPGLTLTSGNKRVLATATIAGTVFETGTSPLTNGTLTLFKVTPVGAYEKTQEKIPVAPTGSYLLEKVVLDDYVLLAEPDETDFPDDLPTYYTNTSYWEEATKIILNENRTDANIAISKKPTVKPNGGGTLDGVFYDSNPAGGRTADSKRIGGAGVSVRRKTNTGKPKEEVLTIIAYTQTNELGEFLFEKLEPGEYLLNLQQPGLPMDPTTDINIVVGSTNISKKATVQAFIEDNKIKVTKLTITGLEESESRFTVYPNPANASFTIKMLQSLNDLSYTITDAMGQELLSQELGANGIQEVDASRWNEGVYLVTVRQDGSIIKTFRIVVSH